MTLLALAHPLIFGVGVVVSVLVLWAAFVLGAARFAELADRLPVTLELGAVATTIAVLIALPVGVVSATRRDTLGDYVARSAAVAASLGARLETVGPGHLVVAAAHEALDGVDGVFRIGDGLALGDLTDEAFARLGEADHGGGGPATFLVRDDDGLAAFHDGHHGVGGAEVNADDLAHVVVVPLALNVCLDLAYLHYAM